MTRALAAVLLALGLIACSLHGTAGAVEQGTVSEQPTNHGGLIPFKDDQGLGYESVLRSAVVLALVLMLAAGAMFLLKRYVLGFAQPSAGHIRLLEVRRVSAKLTLVLVEVGGETYLLAQSGEHVLRIAHSSQGSDPGPQA